MKSIFFLFFAYITLTAFSQTQEDSLAIRKAVTDYVVGWAGGDVDRIQGAVSPELSKRRVSEAGNQVVIQDMSRSLLCASALGNAQGVRMKDQTPGMDLVQEVKILDIEGTNASAKTWNLKYGFFDYIHLSKAGGKWMIINVLWDMNSKK